MEIFKSIKGYEYYEVSNFGNVKSLRVYRGKKDRILKPFPDRLGYLSVVLCHKSKRKSVMVHQLVAIAFLNHNICGHKLVVNHIDFSRTNNNVNNLEIVTQRQNSNKKHILISSSKYTGVIWDKRRKNWRAEISLNGKTKYLGCSKDEYSASLLYEKALNSV